MNCEYQINYDLDSVFIRAASHVQPIIQGWWIQLVSATKSKGDPPKENFDRLLILECGFSYL